jgi:hypothetical protein
MEKKRIKQNYPNWAPTSFSAHYSITNRTAQMVHRAHGGMTWWPHVIRRILCCCTHSGSRGFMR